MPKDEEKKARRCSYCNVSGHTRRTCLVLRSHSAGVTPRQSPVPRRKRSLGVQVHSGREADSPHIIRLAPPVANVIWQGVEPYQEEKTVPAVRATLPLVPVVPRQIVRTVAPPPLSLFIRQPIMSVSAIERIRHLGYNVRTHFKRRRQEKFFLKNHAKPGPEFSLVALRARFVPRIHKLIGATVAASLLIAIPFPAASYYRQMKEATTRLVEMSTSGFLSLQASTVAAFSSNLPQAEMDLTAALQSFAAAKNIIEKDHNIMVSLAGLLPIIGPEVQSREHLLVAGQHLALGNTYLVKGIGEAGEQEAMPQTERFQIIRDHLQSALPQYRAALAEVAGIDPKTVPVEYQATFEEFKMLFATLVDDMKDLVGLIDAMNLVFGGDSFRRYLIVFQNHHELRPTGGFMGSFAIMDVQKGKVISLTIPPGGTYDLQGQLPVYLQPPLPLQLVNSRWEFQDANWFPDFGATAEKLAWFYRQGRGTTVDGVMAVNASVLPRLLRVLGPVTSEKYALVLDSDSALSAVEAVVENGAEKAEGRPKAILSELMGEMTAMVEHVEPADAMKLLSELHSALQEKEIQVYFQNPEVQDTFRQYGWTGELLAVGSAQDYLAVNIANLQGQKSDAAMSDVIEHETHILPDGSIENTVTLRRTHSGGGGVPLYGVPNMGYVRAYVPQGSTLIAAGGFTFPPEAAFHVPEPWYEQDDMVSAVEGDGVLDEATGTRITEEFGKTVFGNWVLTNPGETSEIFFTYRLPFRLAETKRPGTTLSAWQSRLGFDAAVYSRYERIVQKQSGTHSRYIGRIIYPSAWTPVWKSDERMDLARNGATLDLPLATDTVIGLLMEKIETDQ